jgi:hypothetical protein
VRVIAVVCTLGLLGLSGLLLRTATRRLERAAELVDGLTASTWTERSGELRAAGDELRDAVAARAPR